MSNKSNPNPLFTKWLTEWRNSAKNVGSKMEYVYNKALRSLREHPNTLTSGQECKQLNGFGDKLCKKIEDKLREHRGESQSFTQIVDPTDEVSIQNKNSERHVNRNIEITDLLKKKKKRSLINNTPNKISSPLRKVRKTKTNKQYIPGEGSGAYAILLALFKSEIEDSIDSLGKQELQSMAQEFAKTSMTCALPGSHYTGWHSIKTLINKNLIEKSNNRNANYYLTQSGRDIASKLFQIHNEKESNLNHNNNVNSEPVLEIVSSNSSSGGESSDSESIFPERNRMNNIESNPKTVSLSSQTCTQSSSNTSTERFTLLPNSFDIILCIDTREQASGVNREMRKTALLSALQQNGVKVEMRTLSVGDFVWIAKQTMDLGSNIAVINNNRSQKELLLDFVIERKRIDDLASSLKDRRWDEQKYRLFNCGVRKPTYIIEYFGSHLKRGEFGGIKCETLDQAITNAQIDGLSIKRCDSFDETIRYLTLMTRYLESFFKLKTLYSCSREQMVNKDVDLNHFMTFNEFSRNATKITNFTVSEMFAKHLLQIKGVSVSKAKVIIDNYPTLQSLLDAFSISDNQKDREKLLSSLKCGLMERKFGPNLSVKIYKHYSK